MVKPGAVEYVCIECEVNSYLSKPGNNSDWMCKDCRRVEYFCEDCGGHVTYGDIGSTKVHRCRPCQYERERKFERLRSGTGRVRNKLIRKYGKVCQECGASSTDIDMHHIVPISKGGKTRLDNCILLCKPCHNEVHNKQNQTGGIMVNQGAKEAVRQVIKEDKNKISYRPSWRKIAGSLTSAILLGRVEFWWDKMGGPFYKFNAPPKPGTKAAKFYKEGQSWIEETGMTITEFQTACKRLGAKLSKDEVKDWRVTLQEKGYLVGWFTDQKHLTWWYFNEALFTEKLVEHYLPDDENFPIEESPIGKSPNGESSIGYRIRNPQSDTESGILNRILSITNNNNSMGNDSVLSVWDLLAKQIQLNLGKKSLFGTPFNNGQVVGQEDGVLTVALTAPDAARIVNLRYRAVVERAIGSVMPGLNVEFVQVEVEPVGEVTGE